MIYGTLVDSSIPCHLPVCPHDTAGCANQPQGHRKDGNNLRLGEDDPATINLRLSGNAASTLVTENAHHYGVRKKRLNMDK